MKWECERRYDKPSLHLRLAWEYSSHHLILLVALPCPFPSSPSVKILTQIVYLYIGWLMMLMVILMNKLLIYLYMDACIVILVILVKILTKIVYLYVDACIGKPSSTDSPFSRGLDRCAQQLWVKQAWRYIRSKLPTTQNNYRYQRYNHIQRPSLSCEYSIHIFSP